MFEINLQAKELKLIQRAARDARNRAMLAAEDATYTVETSILAELIRRSFPDVADTIIEKLVRVYETLDMPIERAQFRRANDIDTAFTWANTTEGGAYWERIHIRTATQRTARRRGEW